MNEDHYRKRIENIKQMFLEVASGNFSHRIERSDYDDELEKVVVSANKMGERLKAALGRLPYIKYGKPCKYVVEMSFVLDDNFHICSVTPQVFDILLFKEKEMLGKSLGDFLMEESKPLWRDFRAFLSGKETFDHILELTFRARQFFIVPATCLISRLSEPHNRGTVIVTTVNAVWQNEDTDDDLSGQMEKGQNNPGMIKTLPINLSDSDLKKIGSVEKYIVNHLEEASFSITGLAKTFSINEFKLKYGFKQLYGTTIFRYLRNERLNRANLLLKHSGKSISEIARDTGFKTTTHFSRVFREKYDCSPREFRKLAQGKRGRKK